MSRDFDYQNRVWLPGYGVIGGGGCGDATGVAANTVNAVVPGDYRARRLRALCAEPAETLEAREKRIRKTYMSGGDVEFLLGLLDKCRDHITMAESWIHNWHEWVTATPRADKIDTAAWLADRPGSQGTQHDWIGALHRDYEPPV